MDSLQQKCLLLHPVMPDNLLLLLTGKFEKTFSQTEGTDRKGYDFIMAM